MLVLMGGAKEFTSLRDVLLRKHLWPARRNL
jgi:hypothetical protein